MVKKFTNGAKCSRAHSEILRRYTPPVGDFGGVILTKYRLYEYIPFREWVKMTGALERIALSFPLALAQLGHDGIINLCRPSVTAGTLSLYGKPRASGARVPQERRPNYGPIRSNVLIV